MCPFRQRACSESELAHWKTLPRECFPFGELLCAKCSILIVMKLLTRNFFGYIMAFMAILIASFALMLGLGYVSSQGIEGETSCMTSAGESC